jgi:hypothetical protein
MTTLNITHGEYRIEFEVPPSRSDPADIDAWFYRLNKVVATALHGLFADESERRHEWMVEMAMAKHDGVRKDD